LSERRQESERRGVSKQDLFYKALLGKIDADRGFTWSRKIGDCPRLYASVLRIAGERAEVAGRGVGDGAGERETPK
jgi:hypothetical protein